MELVGKKRGREKSVLEKVIGCIRHLKSSSGSSAKAIISLLAKSEDQGGYCFTNDSAVKKVLKKGVVDKVLIQNKASYLAAGDEIYPDLSEKVDIDILETGKGDEKVIKGSRVVIAYKGWLKASKTVFDSSKSFSFQVAAGDVIKGMDMGVLGMALGERRRVTIPASLGYGKRGSGPEIPPDSDLVFDFSLSSMR
jgi:FKBP-type peptidyl-prolyl cis-trans isomerase